VSASLRAVGRRAALTASAESVTPSNTSAQEPCVTIEEVMSTSVAVVRPPTAMPTRATLPTGWSAQAASGGLAVVTSLRSAVALDLLRSRATYSRATLRGCTQAAKPGRTRSISWPCAGELRQKCSQVAFEGPQVITPLLDEDCR
jgi:hypothetical protein